MRIFFVVATKEQHDENFSRILEPSLKPEWLQRTLRVYSPGSIFEKYNKAIDILVEKENLQDDDVVVYLHNDVQIKDNHFEEKIRMVFKAKPDVGLIGVYGTTHYSDVGGWWNYKREEYARGNIVQRYPNKEIYTMCDRKGFFDNVVTIDGCIMIFIGKLAKMKLFDSKTYNGYHQYDCDTCMEILEKTSYKIAVADILVFHDSPGVLSNQELWFNSIKTFNDKWTSKGYTFPLSIESFKR